MTAPSLSPPVLTRSNAARDCVDVRRIRAFGGLDTLRATYVRHSFSPHFHETFAIGVVTRGACAMACRGATYLLRPGHLVLIAPGEVHTGQRVGDEGWSYRMIYPESDVLAAAAAGIDAESPAASASIQFRSPVVSDTSLARSFLSLHRVLGATSCPMEQEATMLEFLRTLLVSQSAAPPPTSRLPSYHAMRTVREYMQAHFTDPITLDTIAGVAGLSCFYVVRVFRAAFGMTPHAYLAILRLERARMLLRAGTPIAYTALASGFSDQSHLTRFFKRVFGTTPGVYARAVRAR